MNVKDKVFACLACGRDTGCANRVTCERCRRTSGRPAALGQEPGRAGMIRLLQQFETGGDYAKERHAWVDATSFEEIRAAARRKRLKRK
jgi:hypothetical protein